MQPRHPATQPLPMNIPCSLGQHIEKETSDHTQSTQNQADSYVPTQRYGAHSQGLTSGEVPAAARIVPSFKRIAPKPILGHTNKSGNSGARVTPIFKPAVRAQMSQPGTLPNNRPSLTGLPMTPQPKEASKVPPFVSNLPVTSAVMNSQTPRLAGSTSKTPTPWLSQSVRHHNTTASRQLFVMPQTPEAHRNLATPGLTPSGRMSPWSPLPGSQSSDTASLPATPGKRKQQV